MIYVPVPPTANRLYAAGKKKTKTGKLVPIRRRSDEYNAWIELAMTHAPTQGLAGDMPVHGPSLVIIECPRNRRRDLDNHAKPVLDMLKRWGLIKDDRYIERLEMRWHDHPHLKQWCLVRIVEWTQ